MSAEIHRLYPQNDALPQAASELPAAPDPRQRYLEAVTRMHDEAIVRQELEACVDALAYGLAWVVSSLERLDVAGDVLVKFGRHLEALDAQRRAEESMQTLRDDGGTPR